MPLPVRPPAYAALSYTEMVMLRFASLKRRFALPGGFLPVLLIAAVLLCHGVLGVAHLISCDAYKSVESSGSHHGSTTDSGGVGDGQTGEHAPCGLGAIGYAAVVLVAFGVAFLGLLLAARRWRESGTLRSAFRRYFPQVFVPRPRGPTLPSLQVFRL